jgi:hypothetical protein
VTPDFNKICQAGARRKIANYWLQRWSVGGHENEFDIHHWLWTRDDAREWFTKVGFRNLTDWNPVAGKRAIKLQLKYLMKHNLFQMDSELEWYHWLFFEGTK